MAVRPHFAIEVTISHTGRDALGRDIWFIVLNKPDIDTDGPNAPTMLKIVGKEWKLVSHWALHAPDRSIEKYVTATGKIPRR